YEFKSGESLAELVKYAGGLLPSVDKNSLQVEGFDQKSNQKEIKSVSYSGLNTIKPHDGDMLKFKSVYKIAENIVTIQGNIKHPGSFQYKDGMHLSDIITNKDELLNRTFTDQAVINRVVGSDKNIISIPVSLNDFFNGLTDPELKVQDIIKVYASTEMSMIDVAGAVDNPGLIPYKKNMTLADILSVVKLRANSNDIVVEISNNDISNDLLTYSPDVIMSRGVEDNPENGSEALEATVTKTEKLTTVYFYEYLTKERKVDLIELKPNDKLLFRMVTNDEALRTVKILGYVNNPGVFQIKKGMVISDLIAEAGGLAPNAYLKGMVFLRDTVNSDQLKAMNISSLDLQDEIITKALEAQSFMAQGENNITNFLSIQKGLIDIMKQKAEQKFGRIIIDVADNSVNSLTGYNNLELQDGDEVIIPQSPNYVMVIGEVYNQSAVVFAPDRIADFYLHQVGGMTPRARKNNTFVLKANGSVIKGKDLKTIVLDPGDSIIVPRKIKTPINVRGIIKDIAQIGANAAQTVYILMKI
ncbi:MAG: SLBB domain-containing protein, partial [Vampirovibrionia bacterium]